MTVVPLNSSGQNPRTRLALAAILICFVAWQLHSALACGRLAMLPAYDDIVYLNSAIARIRLLQDQGALATAADLMGNPPHSPLAVAMAMLGFAVFGPFTWAPYVVAGAMLIPLAILVQRAFRELPWWSGPLVTLLLCCLPFSAYTITEFRPDLWSAILFLCGIAAGWRIDPADRRAVILPGAILGIAVLAKPSTLPVSVVLIGTTALSLMGRWWILGRITRIRAALPVLAILLLTVLLIDLPYFILNWNHVFSYIWKNTFGANRAIWDSGHTPMERVTFYLIGPGANILLGHMLLVAVPFAVAGGHVLLLSRQKGELGRRILLAMVMAAPVLAGAIPLMVSPNQTPFIGALVPIGMAMASVAVVGESLRLGGAWWRGLFLVVGAGAVLFFAARLPRVGSPSYLEPDHQVRLEAKLIVARLEQRIREGAAEPMPIDRAGIGGEYVTALKRMDAKVYPIYVSGNTSTFAPAVLTFIPLLDGSYRSAGLPVAKRMTFNARPEEHRAAIAGCSWFLEINPSAPHSSDRFSQMKILDRILAFREDLGFIPVDDFTLRGRPFARLHLNPAAIAIRHGNGWGNWEGPYPEANLPRFRWALGPEATATIPAVTEAPLRMALEIDLRPAVPTTVTLLVDGIQVASQDVRQAATIQAPIRIGPKDAEVTLRFSDWKHPLPDAREIRPLAAMVTRLQLVRPSVADQLR